MHLTRFAAYSQAKNKQKGLQMSKNNLQDNLLKSIKELENYKFFIPSYQRGYRGGDREVGALLEDIWDFANTEQKGGSFYCLQPLVVKNNSPKYNVIDGQQRLTTIFLIVKFLDNKDLFTLEYQTRVNSAEFLKNIANKKEGKQQNIDFFHFAKAYEIISKFFNDKGINDRKKFLDTLYDKCKVLWYEAQEKENDVFIRLNIGKIPLLEAENIKALFLSGNENLDDEIRDRAEFWYESEIKAREEYDFRYCVLSKVMPNDILKDENNKPILRDDILRIEAYLKAIVPTTSNKHYLFDYFYKNYKDKKLDEKWKELQSAIKTLSSFASKQGGNITNRQIFHYLGFLTLSNYSIFSIYQKWVALQDSEKFSGELLKIIKNQVRGYIDNIESLSYTDKKEVREKIHLLLLLSNLEYMILDEGSRDFFKFNRFVLEQWSLEHIYAQNSKSIAKAIKDKDNNEISAWLKEVLKYIDDNDLKQEIENGIANNDFNKSLFEKIDENFKNDDTLNSISNLALLDKESNSRLGNLIFSEKHKEIYKLGSQDKLIPIMTKKVFAKDIEGLDYSHKDFFGEQDRVAYLDNINKLLAKYRSE